MWFSYQYPRETNVVRHIVHSTLVDWLVEDLGTRYGAVPSYTLVALQVIVDPGGLLFVDQPKLHFFLEGLDVNFATQHYNYTVYRWIERIRHPGINVSKVYCKNGTEHYCIVMPTRLATQAAQSLQALNPTV